MIGAGVRGWRDGIGECAVRDGIILDDPDDEGAIARSVRRLAGDEGLRRRLGTAAAEKMRDHSWDRVAARTLDVYDHLLANGHVH